MYILKVTTLCFIIFFSTSILSAQQVEIIGELKVSTMSEDETASDLVVRKADGTMGYRDAASLESQPFPKSGIILSQTSNNTELINAGFSEIGKQEVQYAEKSFGVWTATTVTDGPIARENHSAIWTGNEMIVWGGYDGTSTLADGYFYIPATNKWSSLVTANQPSARGGHTAVWTGSEMIIWGGSDGVSLNTGSMYDYTVDQWFILSNNGAPSARYLHSAVWTGTEMIVWGGVDGTGYKNTGARFNPTTNTWTAMSITGAPSLRGLHTAVWTGTEMVIWGGYNGFTELGDGASYNPITDSWTAITMTDAPAARAGSTAAWTGSEVLIWGGWKVNPSENFTSGGKYDPSTDNWKATSNAQVPIERKDHTATWTGSDFIIFGGTSAVTLNNKFYEPNANKWSLIDAANEPSQRSGHTAIWTGSTLIIWGGYYGGFLNTGAVLNPYTPSGYGPFETVENYLYWKD